MQIYFFLNTLREQSLGESADIPNCTFSDGVLPTPFTSPKQFLQSDVCHTVMQFCSVLINQKPLKVVRQPGSIQMQLGVRIAC